MKSYPPVLVSSGVLAPAGGTPPGRVISYVLNTVAFLPRCWFKPAPAGRLHAVGSGADEAGEKGSIGGIRPCATERQFQRSRPPPPPAAVPVALVGECSMPVV